MATKNICEFLKLVKDTHTENSVIQYSSFNSVQVWLLGCV